MLGRILDTDEEVDHIDGNKFNDSDDNLQILSSEAHTEKSNQDTKDMTPIVEKCIAMDVEKYLKKSNLYKKRIKY